MKICEHEGCTNKVRSGGVCIRHGAKVTLCKHEGCTNHVRSGGVCIRHGATVKICEHEGCTTQVRNKGVCYRHRVKVCEVASCTNETILKTRRCVHHFGPDHQYLPLKTSASRAYVSSPTKHREPSSKELLEVVRQKCLQVANKSATTLRQIFKDVADHYGWDEVDSERKELVKRYMARIKRDGL